MSNKTPLEDLYMKVRSSHLEHLPEGTATEHIASVVCSFLNSGGGTLITRLSPSGEPASQAAEVIEREIRQRIRPAAFWTTTAEEAENGGYCVFDVPAGRDRPYSADGRIFIRTGTVTVAAAVDEIESMVETGYQEVERWERRPLSGDGLERLDAEAVLETARTGIEKRNYPFSDPSEVATVLKDLSLYRHGAVTNAAEVLFGVRPAIQFPQVRARVTVYAAGKGGEFIDSRTFDMSVFKTLEAVLDMIKQHTPVASTFPPGLQRADRPAFHEKAVREGLVNAFVHRDYSDFSGGVSVDLYPDRLVIWNSGQLPPGIKIGDLEKEHPSMPRNPDIAQVFWLRSYMERVGRGTQNIVDWCISAGLGRPKWKSGETGVTLTFPARRVGESVKLNARQQKLLSDLSPGESIRLADFAERYLVSERQGRRDLVGLVDGGWLIREGDGPSTLFIRTSELSPNPAKPGQTRP